MVFDADYLLAGTGLWDEVLAGEPSVMQLITPWPSLGRRVNFRITIIGSGDLSLSRELGDPWAKDSWFVARDPSGDIRRGLEKLGAFKGDRITNESIEQLLVERLKADGDNVTYVRLADSPMRSWARWAWRASLTRSCRARSQRAAIALKLRAVARASGGAVGRASRGPVKPQRNEGPARC